MRLHFLMKQCHNGAMDMLELSPKDYHRQRTEKRNREREGQRLERLTAVREAILRLAPNLRQLNLFIYLVLLRSRVALVPILILMSQKSANLTWLTSRMKICYGSDINE